MLPTSVLVLLALAAESPPSPPADPPSAATAAQPPPASARLDLTAPLTVSAVTLGLTAALTITQERLAAPACRWCQPPAVDLHARDALLWEDAAAARHLSDTLEVVVPLGASAALGLMSWRQGGGRETAEDLTLVLEATSVTMLLTQGTKLAVARLRPDAWAATGAKNGAGSVLSFWSGHTSFTFSVAAAVTQVARMRGRTGWGWLSLAAFTGAAAVGWLRVAGDRHWLSDVVVGAGVGTTTGLLVPWLTLSDAPRPGQVALAPFPGGLAVVGVLP